MKLRIVSDGSTGGTHVTTPNGEELRGVKEVTWKLTAGDRAEVTLRLKDVEVDVVGLLEAE